MNMISNYKRTSLLFASFLATLASSKQEACNSPSAVDYDSCTVLSTNSHPCVWCKTLDDVKHDVVSTSSFCTSTHRVSKKEWNRMECESNKKTTNYIYSNSTITNESSPGVAPSNRDVSDGVFSKRNVSNEDKVDKDNILNILKSRGRYHEGGLGNQQYRNLQVTDDFCGNLTVSTYNGHLYGSLTASLMNWSDAKAYAESLPSCCGSMAHLVSVNHTTEYDVVQRVVQGQNARFWIGLNDLAAEGTFEWLDPTRYSFNAWNLGEPNNGRGLDEDCVEMFFTGSAWTWNDVKCSELRTSYIFEYDCNVCNLRTNQKNQHLYGKQFIELNWYNAQSNVQSLPECCGKTAHLVTIEDTFEYEVVDSMTLKRNNLNAWIGLTDLITEGVFLWVGGAPLSFNAWSSGEPNNVGGIEDCVEIKFNHTGWFWNDANCGNIVPSYVYEYDCDFCSTLTLNQKNQHLYGTQSGDLTWYGAQVDVQSLPKCCGKTAHLVTIQDSVENAVVESFSQIDYNNAWIGLNDIETEGTFKWMDGTMFSYSNWNTDEPNNGEGSDDCVYLQFDGTKWGWNDHNCSETQPRYVFEYDCDFCSTLKLNQNNQHLYGIQTGQLTWNDAQTDVQSLPVCCNATAHLVTIKDANENDVIKSLIKGSSQYFWAGLNDVATEGNFKWVDGSPFSFNDWHKGEPNNVGGNEDCVLIQFNGTEWAWNDENCNITKHSYMFEYDCIQKPPQSTQPTKTPVQPTKTPILPTKMPVLPTKTPVLPTKRPVLPTKTPVLPTKTPVLPTKIPVRPTKKPVRPTKKPVRPTKKPVRPTKKPVRRTKKPVRPTEKPVRPTKKPVRPTKKPVRPTKKPLRPTKKPVRPTKKPVS